MKQSIPVVSLKDFRSSDVSTRQTFIQEMGNALVKYGFVAIEDHGVDPAALQSLYQCVRALFALPTETKTRFELREIGRQRGYTPFGKERAKNEAAGDLKEFWHIGPELTDDAEVSSIPENVWPHEIPGFKSAGMGVWNALSDCANEILKALALYLEADESTFVDMVDGGNTVLRVIRYPASLETVEREEGAVWAAAHEDINLITLLVEATEPGLQLLTREGEWLPIEPVPGQLIVDTGDMMQRITNGKIPSTTHRVLAPPGHSRERYSVPFFVHPRPDVELSVLPSCLEESEKSPVESISAGRYLAQRLRDNGVFTVDISAEDTIDVLVDFDDE